MGSPSAAKPASRSVIRVLRSPRRGDSRLPGPTGPLATLDQAHFMLDLARGEACSQYELPRLAVPRQDGLLVLGHSRPLLPSLHPQDPGLKAHDLGPVVVALQVLEDLLAFLEPTLGGGNVSTGEADRSRDDFGLRRVLPEPKADADFPVKLDQSEGLQKLLLAGGLFIEDVPQVEERCLKGRQVEGGDQEGDRIAQAFLGQFRLLAPPEQDAKSVIGSPQSVDIGERLQPGRESPQILNRLVNILKVGCEGLCERCADREGLSYISLTLAQIFPVLRIWVLTLSRAKAELDQLGDSAKQVGAGVCPLRCIDEVQPLFNPALLEANEGSGRMGDPGQDRPRDLFQPSQEVPLLLTEPYLALLARRDEADLMGRHVQPPSLRSPLMDDEAVQPMLREVLKVPGHLLPDALRLLEEPVPVLAEILGLQERGGVLVRADPE